MLNIIPDQTYTCSLQLIPDLQQPQHLLCTHERPKWGLMTFVFVVEVHVQIR